MALDFPSNPTNGQAFGNYIYSSSTGAWKIYNADNAVSQQKANIAGGNTFSGNQTFSNYALTPNRPAFWAWINTTSSSVANNGDFPYNATLFNIGNNFSTSTYRFTAPVAGLYHFGANVAADDGAMYTGKIITFYKNGTWYRDILEGETGNASHWETHGTTTVIMSAGDYMTVTVRGGGTVTLPNGSDGPAYRNTFYGYLVG
jgi:hypothetical protein